MLRDVLAAVAAFFRKSGAAEEKPQAADVSGSGLDESEQQPDLRRRVAAELQQVRKKQKGQHKREQDALVRGRRDHLDSDW